MLINLVGELVITQAMLAQQGEKLDPGAREAAHRHGELERNTRDLQESVMSIRMMPMSFVFSRFPRVVRDTASKLAKEVELKTEGETPSSTKASSKTGRPADAPRAQQPRPRYRNARTSAPASRATAR